MENKLIDKLVATGIFVTNTWFYKYVSLCTQECNEATGYTESHHIIPFGYYASQLGYTSKQQLTKLRHLCANKNTAEFKIVTEDNTVQLSYYQHCLAHYYLFKCTIDRWQIANEKAFLKMTDRNLNLRECTEQEIFNILAYIKDLASDPASDMYKSSKVTEVVLAYYKEFGYKKCIAELETQYHIATTKYVIKARAQKLGIRSDYFTDAWSEEELAILHKQYPIGGWALVAKFLPDRTKNAIQARALYCGLTAPGPSKRTSGWDADAVKLLQQIYPTGGWQAVQKLLPNKSEKAIRRKANNLGLKVNKERIC